MTVVVGPLDAVSSSPDYTAQMARTTFGGGLVGGKTSSRPLGGYTGVWPGTPTSTVSVAGTTVTIATHGGVLDVEASAVTGPYSYAITVAQTQALNAADATNPRIDLISIQLSDPAAGDGTSTPGGAVVYTVGAAVSSPVAPAAPARSLVLAQINVPHSGGGSASVSWVAPYTIAAGGVLPVAGSSAYPASSYEGQYIDDATLNQPMRYNGSAFVPVSPFALLAVGAAAAGTAPSVTSGLFQIQAGSTVVSYATGGVTLTFPTAFPTGLLTFVPSPGDITTPFYQIGQIEASASKTSVKFKCAGNTGTEIPATTSLRINWIAIGW